jgi:hypothetical protein
MDAVSFNYLDFVADLVHNHSQTTKSTVVTTKSTDTTGRHHSVTTSSSPSASDSLYTTSPLLFDYDNENDNNADTNDCDSNSGRNKAHENCLTFDNVTHMQQTFDFELKPSVHVVHADSAVVMPSVISNRTCQITSTKLSTGFLFRQIFI